MNIGATIRALRKRKNLTLLQLSEITKVSTSHLSLIEKNKREPSITVLQSTDDALHINLNTLIFLAILEPN